MMLVLCLIGNPIISPLCDLSSHGPPHLRRQHQAAEIRSDTWSNVVLGGLLSSRCTLASHRPPWHQPFSVNEQPLILLHAGSSKGVLRASASPYSSPRCLHPSAVRAGRSEGDGMTDKHCSRHDRWKWLLLTRPFSMRPLGFLLRVCYCCGLVRSNRPFLSSPTR